MEKGRADTRGQAVAAQPREAHRKVWIPRIRYEILGNLGSDRSLNTYTNHPPAGGAHGRIEREPSESRTRPSDGAVLRKAQDLVQLAYPSADGEAYVLQFAEGEYNVVFSEGGPLVWAVLALCDGTRTVEELLDELRLRFEGPQPLWSEEVPARLGDLVAWRALEAV